MVKTGIGFSSEYASGQKSDENDNFLFQELPVLYELQHSLECRLDKGRTCVEKSVCIPMISSSILQNKAKRNSLIISFTCVRSWWEEEASDVFTSKALQVKQLNDYHVGHFNNNLVSNVENQICLWQQGYYNEDNAW